ncbi:MAG TPA: UDP-N-acetylmuramoyl-tripeptide--D-alanyl-D-alanine ligase [Candidatus Binataceae bacterium]|nr:UDP-N-acetylmuramoyl-tripeptide--D-alanyl-D-alanine ligase [Candidatus Binataceae bacterium]
MTTPIPINQCAFRLDEVAAATGGERFGAPDTIVRGVTADTRALVGGALFVALRGVDRDGHAYLAEAARRGAMAVLVARGRRPAGLAAVEVDDTLAALGALARHHLGRTRAAHPFGCVAIGGAVGKTSTKELCAAVVRALFGETLATPGNLNNLIGVPMTIFTLTERHRAAVLECGTNTRGEIARLAAIVEPDVAAVLNVDIEHSEGLGNLLEIADEEATLFTTARRAVVACTEERLVMERIPRGAAVVTFGAEAAADVRIAARAPAAAGGAARSRVTLALSPRLVAAGAPAHLDAALALLGAAAARNAAAAVAAAAALRARPLEAAELVAVAHALESVAPVAGRLRMRTLGGLLVIDDTYNANPRSVRAALEAAHESAAAPGARLVVALGDMLELGALAPAMHAGVTADVMRLAPAAFIAVGPEMSAAAAHAAGIAGRADVIAAPDSAAAAKLVCALVREGDVVLVKGSRGLRMERIIEALEERFGNRTQN